MANLPAFNALGPNDFMQFDMQDIPEEVLLALEERIAELSESNEQYQQANYQVSQENQQLRTALTESQGQAAIWAMQHASVVIENEELKAEVRALQRAAYLALPRANRELVPHNGEGEFWQHATNTARATRSGAVFNSL
jgi:hypothetical protein